MTRSTFTAETLGVIATVDSSIVLAMMLHEVQVGPLPARVAMTLTESPGLMFEIAVNTDAKNLLLALSNDRIKPPAEKSFITHLLWL